MHNNGTTPQLILPDRRLMPDLTPPSGVNIGIAPHGVILTAFIGEQKLELVLDQVTASQLGANLIGAAAILQYAASQAAAQPKVSLD